MIPDRAQLGRIEQDRTVLERRAKRAAAPYGTRARREAIAAARRDDDAAEAAAAALMGEDRRRGLIPLLLDVLVLAYLLGWFRAVTLAEGEDYPTARGRTLAEDIALVGLFVRGRAGPMELDVRERFAGDATGMVDRFTTRVAAEVRRSVMQAKSIDVSNIDTSAPTAVAVREGLAVAGLSAEKDQDYGIDLLMVNAVLKGYGAGRFDGLKAAMGPMLTGFRYHVTLDERTTEKICRPLAGTVVAKDDPYLMTRIPPLHWKCRTILLPVFGPIEPTEKPPINAAPGFGTAE